MVNKPTNIKIYFDGEGWSLAFDEVHRGKERHVDRPLYGNDNAQEALADALGYFGGLVTKEDIDTTHA